MGLLLRRGRTEEISTRDAWLHAACVSSGNGGLSSVALVASVRSLVAIAKLLSSHFW